MHKFIWNNKLCFSLSLSLKIDKKKKKKRGRALQFGNNIFDVTATFYPAPYLHRPC